MVEIEATKTTQECLEVLYMDYRSYVCDREAGHSGMHHARKDEHVRDIYTERGREIDVTVSKEIYWSERDGKQQALVSS